MARNRGGDVYKSVIKNYGLMWRKDSRSKRLQDVGESLKSCSVRVRSYDYEIGLVDSLANDSVRHGEEPMAETKPFCKERLV